MNKFYIGAHIKKENSLLKTIENIIKNEGNALQIFVSNPRSAREANIEKYKKDVNNIIKYNQENNLKLVIHSSYIINLAKELMIDKRKIDIEDAYWIKCIKSELIISHMIKSIGVVVHVGKYTKLTPDEGINNMAMYIIYLIEYMIENNIKSKIIIETPAGQGTELLTDIDDFITFYNSFSKEQKKYLGICIDTAHVWSNGYEILEIYKKIKDNEMLNEVILIHLNNSKKEKGSKVDVHDSIFNGLIPIEILKELLNMIKENNHNPMIILEEPSEELNEEIRWIKKSLKC
jgi:deoxyribonuclease-4